MKKEITLTLIIVVLAFVSWRALYNTKKHSKLINDISTKVNETPKVDNFMFESPIITNSDTQTFEGKFHVWLKTSQSKWNWDNPNFVGNKYIVTGSGILIWTDEWANGEIPVFIGNSILIQIYPANN